MIKKTKLELIVKQGKKYNMTRLALEFKDNIKKKMMEKFQYKNIYQIPKLTKIVLNMGIGDAKDDSKILDKAQEELSLIAGQKAIKTKYIIAINFI